MEHDSPIELILFFLIAVVIMVPVFKRIHLGAILGYLAAGIIIGPQVLNLVQQPQTILHFSEIGVVMLLFVIGLELKPDTLWKMRKQVFILGSSQLLISALIISLIAFIFLQDYKLSIITGFALALSSTAFAVHLMADKGILASANGRKGFSILLLQDLAVIPILLLIQSLSIANQYSSNEWWPGIISVLSLLIAGRYLINPLLTQITSHGTRESMTAATLLIVVGSAYLTQQAGLSMGIGAFIAGIMLANSTFRHQLENDIEPFKGLTLGLFFIAIGMSLNIELFFNDPLFLILSALGLMLIKGLIISFLLYLNEMTWRQGFHLGLMLCQGGEFAFVIMSQATGMSIFPAEIAGKINLIVGLSMAFTSPLLIIFEFIAHSSSNRQVEPDKKAITTPEVIILGFGRFGQITGRILTANHIPYTALDQDEAHIDFLHGYGNRIHFGDATRLDLLVRSGIESAQTVVIAIDNMDKAEQLVTTIKQRYPELHIIARARNRASHLRLVASGADKVIREVLDGSLQAATDTLISLGFNTGEAIQRVDLFRAHDQIIMEGGSEKTKNSPEKPSTKSRKELEELFNKDRQYE